MNGIHNNYEIVFGNIVKCVYNGSDIVTGNFFTYTNVEIVEEMALLIQCDQGFIPADEFLYGVKKTFFHDYCEKLGELYVDPSSVILANEVKEKYLNLKKNK